MRDSDSPPPPVRLVPKDPEDDDVFDEIYMPLGDHLEELRLRLIRCLLVLSVFLVFGFVFYQTLWQMALYPREIAASWMNVPVDALPRILFLGPFEGFVHVVKLVVYVALIASMPYLLYQAWGFIVPALTRREQRAVFPIFAFGGFLFLSGAAIAYFAAVPAGMRFLVAFDQSLDAAHTEYSFDYYISFVCGTCLGFGLGAETPLIMMALAWTGLLKPETIWRYWRHVILTIVFLGAVLTPPDPVTQLLLAGLMIGLFFLGYLLATWVYPQTAADGE